MTRDLEIGRMSPPELLKSWETCVEDAMRAKISVEDELTKGVRANVRSLLLCSLLLLLFLPPSLTNVHTLQTDHTKRTFDYEPFLKAYIQQLHEEGLLNPLLDRDENGKKRRVKAKG
jgi:ubiquitin carboxyl-terminal hydrolase L5